jgi:nucleolar complex protein 2
MAKQTKRQRKFHATGGVRKRIEKGTITKKGKTNSKYRASPSLASSDPAPSKVNATTEQRVLRPDDLVGKENLGDLDIDSFFAQFATDQPLDEKKYEGKGDGDKLVNAASESVGGDDENSHSESEERENLSTSENTSEEESEVEHSNVDMDEAESGSDVDDDSDDEVDSDGEEDIEIVEARMKKQISKMQQSDPEFHEFLKENEESLLNFGSHESDNDEEATVKDDEDSKPRTTEAGDTSIVLTPELLKEFFKGAFQNHGIKFLRRVVGAYKSACCLSGDTSRKDTRNSQNLGDSGQLYIIESSKVFDELMTTCFSSLHMEFKYYLLNEIQEIDVAMQGKGDHKEMNFNKSENKNDENDDCNKPLNPKILEKATRWDDMKPILLSFFRSTLRLMSEAKEPELLSFIVKSLSHYLQYLTPFPRISELMLKTLVGLWSAPIDTVESYQVVRINAFLRIRQLALTQPFPFIEECLKKTYLAYMKRAKFGSTDINSPMLPTLTFMGNCLVELYSIDYHSSYQHAFVYIRQLALLLRSAMQKKTTDSMQQIYCWQYLQCLKLWVAVLSASAQTDDGVNMKSLIYPLIEIIMGTVRFVPSPVRHMPFRCHCVRLLQQIAASTSLFIPTASLMLDCLDWKEWTSVAKKTKGNNRATTRGVQLHLMLKFGKEDPLRSHDQLEAGINELLLLLHREIDLYRYSPGFPEYSTRIFVRLRQFSKDIRNSRWRTYIKACADLCESHAATAVMGRSKLQQAPRDVLQLECLKPLSEKSMYERYRGSLRKEQTSLDAANASLEHALNVEAKSCGLDSTDDADEEIDQKLKFSQKKRRKKSKSSNNKKQSKEEIQEMGLADDAFMETADRVQEGVNWSDDDDADP